MPMISEVKAIENKPNKPVSRTFGRTKLKQVGDMLVKDYGTTSDNAS